VRREGGQAYGGKSYEAIIRDGWKLMQNDPHSRVNSTTLDDDRTKERNLAAANAERVKELAAACAARATRRLDPLAEAALNRVAVFHAGASGSGWRAFATPV